MSELKSLSDIFQNTLFRIPDYQRGYAWQEKQRVDFWEDLINLRPEQGRYHYTGLLSLKPLDKSDAEKLDRFDQWLLESGFKAKHIVDGQQRLTTFMILLNELLIYVCHLPPPGIAIISWLLQSLRMQEQVLFPEMHRHH